ncbi:MAG: AAA family ATPase [Candidatus Thiodiazotropha sp. (ex Semelilucina semeliformis)]|nr:AAA family ATPase [Candidatus Thiodiazotropha sp. (ex Semelilucina semeliformis)]
MFESFYGLSANPFRLSADEGFRYAHRSYVKAWSYLKYALEQAEGFVLITGRPGTGKTTLIRDILSELDDSSLIAVNLVTNQFQSEELLRMVALDFGFEAQDFNKATLLTRISDYATQQHAEGRRVIIIVDEAQNLTDNGLEELRLISNLQVGNQSLFQVFLIGQEELRSLIYGQGLENIKQRILASCRVEPMDVQQTQGYIEHRLGVVGWDHDPEFSEQIFPLIQQLTHGVPREVNHIAGRLLLYGALEEKHQLDEDDLWVVVNELNKEQRMGFDLEDQLAAFKERKGQSLPVNEGGEGETQQQHVSEPDQREETTTLSDSELRPDDPEPEQILPQVENVQEQDQASQEPQRTHLHSSDEVITPSHPTEIEPIEVDLDIEERQQADLEPEQAIASELPDEQVVEKRDVKDGQDFETNHHEESTDNNSPVADDMYYGFADKEQVDETPELPSVHYEGREEQDGEKHSHLLTDVGDLLDNDRRFFKRLGKSWRWLFYPLAIIVLMVMLLVPKPEDLLVLGKHIWSEIQQQIFATEQKMTNTDARPQYPIERSDSTDNRQASDRPDNQALAPTIEPMNSAGVTPEQLPAGKPREDSLQLNTKDLSNVETAMPDEKAQTTGNPQIELNKSYTLVIDGEAGELTSKSRALLSAAVTAMLQNPEAMLVLIGVVETRQPPLERMRTALQYAESVATLVMKQGIPRDQISIEGKDPETQPEAVLAKEDSQESLSGRKVIFKIVPVLF